MRVSISLTVVLALAGASLGQEPEKVRFQSVDGVQLHGTYWPGRGRTPPVVLLVHELGKDSRQKVWRELAVALQKEKYAVLAFDLRGHGLSTEVEPDLFWQPAFPNRAMVRNLNPLEIEFKRFDKRYYPALVNDLAAAKAFLNRKNDAGECNTGSLSVVAAGTGATLASIWINAEWHRYRFYPPSLFGMPATLANSPEGDKLLCGVFLDVTPSLGGRSIPLASLLDVPGRQRKMPLALFHGDENEPSTRLAKGLLKSFEYRQKLPLTTAVEVPGAGELEASGLLQGGLGTTRAIVEYLNAVLEQRGQDWQECDVANAQYVWRVPRSGYQPTPANAKGDRNLYFNSYEGFIPLR